MTFMLNKLKALNILCKYAYIYSAEVEWWCTFAKRKSTFRELAMNEGLMYVLLIVSNISSTV